MTAWTLPLPDESRATALARCLSGCIQPGLVIYLSGDLGAGKTTFARALIQGMGYQGRVKSPTYNLVEIYVISSLYLYHFDLYRFEDPIEWEEAGFREYFNPATVCLVEWPEKAQGMIPPADLHIRLAIQDNGRIADIQANTEHGAACIQCWQTAWGALSDSH